MQWFGPKAKIEIFDREEELQIRVSRLRRRIDFVVWAVLLAILAFLYWRDRSWFYLAALLGVVGSSIFDWLSDGHAELLITDKGVEARHDRSCVRLPWSSISGLDYRAGGEDEPSGLYARRGGWDATHLMNHANKEQVEEMIAMIYHRFPYVMMADDDGGWLPLGGKSGLTTLVLSKQDRENFEGKTTK